MEENRDPNLEEMVQVNIKEALPSALTTETKKMLSFWQSRVGQVVSIMRQRHEEFPDSTYHKGAHDAAVNIELAFKRLVNELPILVDGIVEGGPKPKELIGG